MIAVTSYWTAREIAIDLDPAAIISLMDPQTSGYSIPAGLSLCEHIKLDLHDVVAEQTALSGRYVSPSPEHVGRIIEFARRWDRRGNLLIHCMAGVSRSTAAAMLILAATSPGLEIPIARLIRDRAPWADPNLRIVELGDQLLGRRGALVRALSAMGPSDMRSAPSPILLPNEFGSPSAG